MKSFLFAATFAALLSAACAQPLVTSLIAPASTLASGSTVELELVTLNPASNDAEMRPPAVLDAVLFSGDRSWPVQLHAAHRPPTAVSARSFASQEFKLVLPPEAAGRVILEISQGDAPPLRTALRVGDTPTVAGPGPALPPAEPAPRPLSTLAATPAEASLHRAFIAHFSFHDPIYFIYGADAPAAKFQFSFKYRLLSFTGPAAASPQSLQFGYTQRSLWDLRSASSPFYDTSYMPSLFYELLAPAADDSSGLVTWLGVQAGYQHESNGRAGQDSRSLNTAFVRPALLIGPGDGWHLIVAPRLFAYVGGLSDNTDLKNYRGYGEWAFIFGKNDGPSLSYTGRAGRHFDHFTTQIDLTIPVRTKLLDFSTYLLVQYFNGYGESLRDYNAKSETIRAGISLVR
jgi:outer membrane phospholipase A